MFPIYMKFDRDADGVWHVMFMRNSQGIGTARRFFDFAKIIATAERGRGIKSLADRQGLEGAESRGRGGIDLQLTRAEIERL